MPLKKGKGHIGENVKTEMAHGKPKKVALAIALNVAKVPMKETKAMQKKEMTKETSKESKKEDKYDKFDIAFAKKMVKGK